MWVCQSAAAPGILFSSSSDQTGFLPGWTCERLDKPLAGSSLSQWFTFNKLLRLIDGLPF